jgi:hypothetical protein
MSNDQSNPYAPTVSSAVADTSGVDPVLLAKVNAIIKDAGQFWIAMVLCLLCSALGSLVIGIWYAVRLMQWNAIAKSQPLLMDPNAAPGSVAAKFQGAKTKLIIGMVFGIVILLAGLAYIGFFVLGATSVVQRS